MSPLEQTTGRIETEARYSKQTVRWLSWISWALVGLYLIGVISGSIAKDNRLGVGELLLLLLLLLGAAGFFERISEVVFGEGTFSIKLKGVEKRQENTEKMMAAVRTALEGTVTKYERQHLQKLLPQYEDVTRYGPHFFREIERLDAIGFVAPVKQNGMIAIKEEHGKDGEELHLQEYVKLTEKGRKYLAVIGDMPAIRS